MLGPIDKLVIQSALFVIGVVSVASIGVAGVVLILAKLFDVAVRINQ